MNEAIYKLDLIKIIRDIQYSDPETWKELVAYFVTEDEVIQSVADQIIYSCDADGNAGSTSGSLWTTEYPTPLQVARRYIAELADEATREEHKELVQRCKQLETVIQEQRDQLQDLSNILSQRSNEVVSAKAHGIELTETLTRALDRAAKYAGMLHSLWTSLATVDTNPETGDYIYEGELNRDLVDEIKEALNA